MSFDQVKLEALFDEKHYIKYKSKKYIKPQIYSNNRYITIKAQSDPISAKVSFSI
jgi:hypothetical protein